MLALLLQERCTRQALQQLLAHSSTSSSSEIEYTSDSSNEQQEHDWPVSVAVVTAVLKLRRVAEAMRKSGASAW
jgi:hypothetical protein